MSYTIRTNNLTSNVATISDGTVDNIHTSLTLIGRNYGNYGQIMIDNQVKLLENFAYNIEPSYAVEGQLWWDTGRNLLKICTDKDTQSFKVVGSATAQPTPPSTTVAGDLWWHDLAKQLYIYDGTAPFASTGWILVGPGYDVREGKSTMIWEQIVDTVASTHNVVSTYLDDVRVSIVSTDSEFVPFPSIPGFNKIQPGITANASVGSGTFWGTANNASYLGGVIADHYLRTDIDNTSTGNLRIVNDQGVTIGAGADLTLSVNGIDAQIINNSNNGDVSVFANVAGTLTRALFVNGSTGEVQLASDPTTSTGITTKNYVDDAFVDAVLTGISTAPTAPVGDSTTQIANTEWVINNSGFLKNKIYQGNSFVEIVDIGTGSANLVVDNRSVLTASAIGVVLANGATTTTQPQVNNSTGNLAVATTQYVRTSNQWWGGSAKFVSNVEPKLGVNDFGSNVGDFWFQLAQ